MTAVNVALGSFIVILVGICFGIFLRMNLPQRYLSDKTGETVKLSAGVIATLAALTLGLLIASAKTSYDTRVSEVRKMVAGLLLSDRLLVLYGPETQDARIKLRQMVGPVADQIWAENAVSGPKRFEAATETEDYVNAIYILKPQTEIQRSLRERVVQATLGLANARLDLFSQLNTLLPIPLLAVLAFWFAVLFAAYSMYAEINAVSLVALTICAASVAGAMFLLFQMNSPFSGLMSIPKIDFAALLPPL
ncbi:MAG TPA: hypothetical protein VNR41_13590 [Xanthobacteraceae bacterium]|jgi:hypothetical protein|nr:hypothetical protein [Xanthobacteraceae bacterium]